MKKLTLLLIMAFAVGAAFAQNRDIDPREHEQRLPAELEMQEAIDERHAEPSHFPLVPSKEMFDLLFQFDVGVGEGEYPVATDGDYIYTARWNSTEFYKYEMDGTYLEAFTIPGAGNVRDLTFDGQYFYGSPNSASIYKMDFDNQTLVETITASGTIRGIAYDPINDGFWVTSGWDPPLRLIDRSGNQVETLTTTAASFSGLAWEDASDGTPYLWGYTQPAGTSRNILVQIDITTGQTVQTFDVANAVTFPIPADATSGGLVITDLVSPGKWAFLGMCQNQVIWALELADAVPPGAPAAPDNFTGIAGDMGTLEVELSWDNPDETAGGEPLADLDAVHVYRDGGLIHTINDPTIGGSETYTDTGITESGVYGYAVAGENAEGLGLPVNITVFVGEDVPAAPENIELVADGNDGALTWDAPTSGLNDGYFTGDNLTYTVVRFPDEAEVATGITEEHFTDTEVPGIGNYFYTVTASNHIGEGGTGESNVALLAAGDILFFENFDDVPIGDMPANWERTHTNWAVNNSNNAGGEAPELRFNWSPDAIDVFRAITPQINAANVDHVMLTFLYSVNDFSGDYDLKVQTSLDGVTWTDQWVLEMKQSSRTSDDRDAPGGRDIRSTEEEIILHNVGGEEFYLAFVFDGDSWNINQWYIDDIIVLEAPDIYEVTFHVKEDSADEDPIEGAMISVDGTQLVTGADGMASIMLADDTYTANITASGYVAEEVTFTVDGEDKTVDVHMMDDIVPPFNLHVELIGPNEALFSWNETEAELMLLYQHDGAIPPNPNGLFQADDMVYGTIFDLSAYPDATVSYMDFHHLQWGVPIATYEYLVHVVDWANYEIIETAGPLFTEENDDWEEDVDLGDIDVSGYSQVGILIQPQGYLPSDAYPVITTDATGPNGVSVQAPADNLSAFTLNSPALGDFFINLWITTAYADKKHVQVGRLLANHTEMLETRTGQSMSSAEAYFNQNTYVRALPQNSKAFLGFNVYLDGDLVEEQIAETEYLFTDLPDDMTFTAGVRSVYTTGESEVSTIEFEVPAIPIANWAIYTTTLLIGLFVFFRIRKII